MPTVQDFISAHFSPFTGQSAFTRLNPKSQRGARSAKLYLDRFVSANFPGESLRAEHLVAFMYYRVVGFDDQRDARAGAVSLSTFLNAELGRLMHLLRHENLIDFSVSDLQKRTDFRNAVHGLTTITGGPESHSHSRCIWPCDERRLRSCLTLDTASCRDEALIIVLARTGFRPKSVSEIRCDIHVVVTHDSVMLRVPSVKTRSRVLAESLFLGEDADILRRWITRRRGIFRDSPYLFVTQRGTPVDTNSISHMIGRLSVAAGYGSKFFSAQSFRVGFAHLNAARVYASGGTYAQVIDRVTDGLLWARASRAVDPYINQNIRNYFIRENPLSFDQFLALEPREIHCLSRMHPPQRRPLSFFPHPISRLHHICLFIGVLIEPDQRVTRTGIGMKLALLNEEFADLVSECTRRCTKPRDLLLSDIVGCLLEDSIFDVGRWLLEPFRTDLINAVTVSSYDSSDLRLSISTEFARKTVEHRLTDRQQATRVFTSLVHRKSDRRLHMGRLPNGRLVLLCVPRNETHCREATAIPFFDPESDFPDDASSPLETDDLPVSPAVEPQIAIEEVPRTPPNARTSHTQMTPSTTASTFRGFNTPCR
jgi:hypothetical protein